MNKNRISALLRELGLIKIGDKFRYYLNLLKSYKSRRRFSIENKGIVMPPPYFMYETFNLDYFSFYHKSIETAKWLVYHFEKHKKLENLKILDWGCGPGRVIRHLPKLMSDSNEYFGTDYNKKYIEWCSKHITNVSFSTNQLSPPLDYKSNFFDIIYGISIFTHLSEPMHYAWFDELVRVLKPNGILFITVQGVAFKEKLSADERKLFEKDELVERSKTKEGHRTFGAFQAAGFVRKLIGNHELLEHVAGKSNKGKIEQDVWIIRKKSAKNITHEQTS